MSEDRGDGVSQQLYRGIWSTLSGAFRVPREPPALPAMSGERTETFRPAPGFLRYLKIQFWLVLLLIDGVLVAGWVTVSVLVPWLGALLAIPVLGFIVIPDLLAYTAIHLRYDTTWYVLSDRSLRIRRGIMTIVETTITFDNVQNVKIKQGPLQRRCGIASILVETAGGGEKADEEGGGGAHVGLIEGVADPHRIRDQILLRVRGEELGDEAQPKLEPWPESHLAVLREIRRSLDGARQGEAESPPMPADQDPLPAGFIVKAVERLFRLPDEPLALPPWAGQRYRFRPARPYLWYQLTAASLTGLLLAAMPWGIAIALGIQHPDLIGRVNLPLLLGLWLILLLVVLAVSLLTAWLQYRVTWYVLGEHGLRIRRGVWVSREATISFDNVQNVNLRQGPLERLFGLSGVRIYTAGGGSSAAGGGAGPLEVLKAMVTIVSMMIPALSAVSYGGGGQGKKSSESTAVGRLVGISEAPAIRDRIMNRVRRSWAAGLGDERDHPRRVCWTPEQLEVLCEIRRTLAS